MILIYFRIHGLHISFSFYMILCENQNVYLKTFQCGRVQGVNVYDRLLSGRLKNAFIFQLVASQFSLK